MVKVPIEVAVAKTLSPKVLFSSAQVLYKPFILFITEAKLEKPLVSYSIY